MEAGAGAGANTGADAGAGAGAGSGAGAGADAGAGAGANAGADAGAGAGSDAGAGAGAGSGAGAGAGSDADANGAPQCLQNLAPSSTGVLQFGQAFIFFLLKINPQNTLEDGLPDCEMWQSKRKESPMRQSRIRKHRESAFSDQPAYIKQDAVSVPRSSDTAPVQDLLRFLPYYIPRFTKSIVFLEKYYHILLNFVKRYRKFS